MTAHHFDVEEAVIHGVEKAVILQNLRFWLEKNRANKSNIEEGRYWTFNTAEAFTKLFPYFSKYKINRMLKQLETDGYLITGCFNKKGYDRTKWYSLPEFVVEEELSPDDTPICKSAKSNSQKCKKEVAEVQNPICRSATPIPDINHIENQIENTDEAAPANSEFEIFYQKAVTHLKTSTVLNPFKPINHEALRPEVYGFNIHFNENNYPEHQRITKLIAWFNRINAEERQKFWTIEASNQPCIKEFEPTKPKLSVEEQRKAMERAFGGAV